LLRGVQANARLTERFVTHRRCQNETGHGELHALRVDVPFGMQTCDDLTHVPTADADVARELVEANETPTRLRSSEMAQNASGERFGIDDDGR
jgi:hypothetical protein